MAILLRRLPFFEDATSLRIPGGPAFDIKHDHIILWVSIAAAGWDEPPRPSFPFPAVLDLGFNGAFLLREDHAREWAKVHPNDGSFSVVGTTNVRGVNAAIFDGDLWLHPNVPGFRDQLADRPAFRLEMDPGIAVVPQSLAQIRLPLVGLSTLRRNGLILTVNGAKKQVSLRT